MSELQIKRIERWLRREGEWDTIWNIIKRDPMLIDHVFKYLRDTIHEWEYRHISAAELDYQDDQQ